MFRLPRLPGELTGRWRTWRSENERALDEDPERWPQQASNFNLVPVNIEVRTNSNSLPTSLIACRFFCCSHPVRAF